jgi:hypothetical protein
MKTHVHNLAEVKALVKGWIQRGAGNEVDGFEFVSHDGEFIATASYFTMSDSVELALKDGQKIKIKA